MVKMRVVQPVPIGVRMADGGRMHGVGLEPIQPGLNPFRPI